MGFSLDRIKEILSNPEFDPIETLKDQEKILILKRDRLSKIIETIEETIQTTKGGEKMKTDDLYSAITTKKIEEMKKEVHERWGHTKAYKQSVERTKSWTKNDYLKAEEEIKEINESLARNIDKGVESQEVQELIDKKYKYINKFYDCSYEMFKNLGKMYVEDPKFAVNYRKYHPELPELVSKAIDYYCDSSGN